MKIDLRRARPELDRSLAEHVRRQLWINLLTPLGFAILIAWIDPVKGALPVLELPGGLIGLIAPVIGLRWFKASLRPAETEIGKRAMQIDRSFRRANTLSEAGAFIGVLAWTASNGWLSWAGVMLHVIVTGALWPADERIEQLLDGNDDEPEDEPADERESEDDSKGDPGREPDREARRDPGGDAGERQGGGER